MFTEHSGHITAQCSIFGLKFSCKPALELMLRLYQQNGMIRGWDTEEQDHKYILIPWELVVRIEERM